MRLLLFRRNQVCLNSFYQNEEIHLNMPTISLKIRNLCILDISCFPLIQQEYFQLISVEVPTNIPIALPNHYNIQILMNNSVLLLLLNATIILLFCYIKRKFAYWQRVNVPYIKPKFPYGNMTGMCMHNGSSYKAIAKYLQSAQRKIETHWSLCFYSSGSSVSVLRLNETLSSQ